MPKAPRLPVLCRRAGQLAKDSWRFPLHVLFAGNPCLSWSLVVCVLRLFGHILFYPRRNTRNIFVPTGNCLSVLVLPAKLPLNCEFCLPAFHVFCHPRLPGAKKNCFQVLQRSVKRCPTRRSGSLFSCNRFPITTRRQYRCKRQTKSGVGLPSRVLVPRHGKHCISRVTGLE